MSADELATKLVGEEEGCSLKAYRDTRGLWTIGYGHLLPNQRLDYSGLVWTQAEADEDLEIDMQRAWRNAAALPGFQRCNDVRQAVLVSMCFQLGDLHDWPHFRAGLALGDYEAAAEAGLDSDWAREQTPRRAERQMTMLRTGEWHERT